MGAFSFPLPNPCRPTFKGFEIGRAQVARPRQVMSISASGGSGQASVAEKRVKEKLKTSSDIIVNGEGGDKSKLGALRSLDQGPYEDWVATIKNNPKIVEMEVVGIWTLISDKAKSLALAKAYSIGTEFKRIASTVTMDGNLFLVQDREYSVYDRAEDKVVKSGLIDEIWPKAPKKFNTIDASFDWDVDAGDKEGKIYFFKGAHFLRLDKKTRSLDPGYPKPIQGTDKQGKPYWPDLTFDRIDAAVNWGDGSVYFFSGTQYVRFNIHEKRVDPGYPRPIHPYWAGVGFERIDAAVTWGSRKVIFFRGNEYIRYDKVECQADPGYPKAIVGSYVEDWEIN